MGILGEARIIGVLSFSVLVAQNANLIVPPLLVDIAFDMDVSVPVAGQLATATFAAWAVSVVCGGPLSDSFERRWLALAGLLILLVSVTASAFAPNLEVLLVLRAASGFGGGMLPPNAMGVIADTFSPERRARAIGTVMASNVISAGLTVPLMAVLADWQGWRIAFFVSGMLLAASLLSTWFWFPRGNRDRTRNLEFFSRFQALLSLRFFQVAVTVNTIQRMAFWAFVSFFSAFLIQTHGVSVGFLAVPLVITALAQTAGSYVAPLISNNRTYAVVVASTSVAGGVCGLLFFAVDLGLWTSVAIATVGTGLLAVTFPTLVSVSTRFSGRSTATGVGLMGLSNQGGGVFGAALAGGLLASSGFAAIGYMCLGVTILCGVTALIFGRHGSPGEE